MQMQKGVALPTNQYQAILQSLSNQLFPGRFLAKPIIMAMGKTKDITETSRRDDEEHKHMTKLPNENKLNGFYHYHLYL